MADTGDEKICANEVCNCPVPDGTECCSPTCDTAVESGITEITCDCGHSRCVMEASVTA